MNIAEYISSGIIEAYVLGLASALEKNEFEQLCLKHPELLKARIEFEIKLEQKALAGAVSSPPNIKERAFEIIRQENAVDAAQKIIRLSAEKTIIRKINFRTWMVAASIALVVSVGGVAFYLYNKNRNLQEAIANTNKRIESNNTVTQNLKEAVVPQSDEIQQVKSATHKDIPASINVFWDSINNHVYLIINDLKRLPTSQKYQLWSLSKGEHKSHGLFDAPDGNRLILKLIDARVAESFSISIADLNATSSVNDSGTIK